MRMWIIIIIINPSTACAISTLVVVAGSLRNPLRVWLPPVAWRGLIRVRELLLWHESMHGKIPFSSSKMGSWSICIHPLKILLLHSGDEQRGTSSKVMISSLCLRWLNISITRPRFWHHVWSLWSREGGLCLALLLGRGRVGLRLKLWLRSCLGLCQGGRMTGRNISMRRSWGGFLGEGRDGVGWGVWGVSLCQDWDGRWCLAGRGGGITFSVWGGRQEKARAFELRGFWIAFYNHEAYACSLSLDSVVVEMYELKATIQAIWDYNALWVKTMK